MIAPGEHISDEELSALVDERLTPQELSVARAHVDVCSACRSRLEDLRTVAGLLRALPMLEPPRSFALGPRALADPPNVIRLRRWYTATRVAAGSLAAVFVLLSVGTLYVDSRPSAGGAAAGTALKSQPEIVSSPAPAQPPGGAFGAPAAQTAPQPAGATANDAQTARQSAPAAGGPAPPAPAPRPAAAGEASDQVAAATTVRPLPTPVPTPLPAAAPTVAPAPAERSRAEPRLDAGAPLRTAAVVVGVLTVVTLLATAVVRHRLRAAV